MKMQIKLTKNHDYSLQFENVLQAKTLLGQLLASDDDAVVHVAEALENRLSDRYKTDQIACTTLLYKSEALLVMQYLLSELSLTKLQRPMDVLDQRKHKLHLDDLAKDASKLPATKKSWFKWWHHE